ncbi:hypothetical protein JCM9279_003756 [Rhodotorula babjevae]
MRALSSAALGAAPSPAPDHDPPPAAAPPGDASGDPRSPPADSSDEPKPLGPAVQHADQSACDNPDQHDHVRRLHAQLDAHFHLQQQQQPSPELDDLDEPLFFAARRRGRSADPASPPTDDEPPACGGESTRRAKQRPASSYIPASAWSTHLSQLALAPRKSAARASSASPTGPSRSPLGGSDEHDPAARRAQAASEGRPSPTRARSSSADGPFAAAKGSSSRLNRTSPAPLFRHSLRLPFLPPIPASPLPSTVTSPGLTRSASSPPILPDIALGGPLSPSFALVPPTAPLSPSAPWPHGDGAARDHHDTTARVPPPLVYRSSTSASAPDLSLFSYAPVSEASSYFSSPAPTAASSPTAATVPLPPLASALGLTSAGAARAALEYDSELVADDVAAAAAALAEVEAQERANAAQLDERRYHALVELVDTERGYLEHLRVLVQVYFRTLPFLTALTAAEVQAVIRNANELLELHERIADRIDQVERELSWRSDGAELDAAREDVKRHQAFRTRKAAGRIARVFADEASSFELYNDFCARHAEALDITRSVASRPEWEAFERQCAARVALDGGRGDRTPIASASSSGFFPPVSAAASASPLPFSATPLTTPSHSSGSVPTMASFAASASSSVSRTSRLRFVDYAIAPVQRVTRYPLVFGQLAKFFVGAPEHADLSSTWSALKKVAQGVDAAKREREGEMRTKVVARRMEFNTPLVGGTFCDILGPTLLVGALHVIHSGGALAPPAPLATTAGVQQLGEVLKVKYLGCFLYRSHLVMAKVKKRASYEPKEWLPLRLLEIQGVDEGQGLLSHSIRLSFRDHQFELGALCDGERAVWLSQLLAAQAEARRVWDTQDRDEHGKPTLFDDSVVSSVATDAAVAQRRSHSRSASSVSVVTTFGGSSNSHAPSSSNSPILAQEEPVPPVPTEFVDVAKTPSPTPPAAVLSTSAPLAPVLSPPSSTLTLATTPTLASRSRFSSTASSLLLGRTPASQRAAVDLRLADVFSEECLSARAQAAREVELDRAASLASRRFRTISGPKRSMTALAPGSSTHASTASPPFSSHKMLHGPGGSVRERRRMSSAEVGLALAERAEFRGAIGFDASHAALYHHSKAPGLGLAGLTAATPAADKERGRSWANAIRKAGHKPTSQGGGSTGASASKPRPALSDIDTALAERTGKRGPAPPLSAGASWTRRGGRERERDRDGGLGGQLRRVASVDATPLSHPAPLLAPHGLSDAPSTSATVPGNITASISTAASGSTADVERNNSVSSTTSSSGTGTNSSSSHAHSMQLIDTPPSSIPPSPDFGTVELADALCAPPPPPGLGSSKPACPALPPQPQHASPRWSTVSDGMSSVFRVRRRKSTLGLVPPAFPTRTSPSASDESLTLRSPTLHGGDSASSSPHLVPASAAVKLQRRASTTISGLFSHKKRTHSSPSLAGSGGYFGGASSSSPHLPLSRTSTNSGSSSQATSPQGTPEQVPTTPESSSSRELAPASSSASVASTTATSGSSASKPAPAASAMKRGGSSGGSKGPMLLRTRTRFLFASHNGMTPMS